MEDLPFDDDGALAPVPPAAVLVDPALTSLSALAPKLILLANGVAGLPPDEMGSPSSTADSSTDPLFELVTLSLLFALLKAMGWLAVTDIRRRWA